MKPMPLIRTPFCILLLVLCLVSTTVFAETKIKKKIVHVPSVPGELVVRLGSNGSLKAANTFKQIALELQNRLPSKSVSVTVRTFTTSEEFAVFRLREADKKTALKILNDDTRVAYAEPNYIYRASGMPNDALFSKLWGMRNTRQSDSSGQMGKAGADISVTRVWEDGLTGRKDIKVAVIDSGIDHTHPDLAANIWVNTAEVADDGIDNDNNGFIDDVRGWNFKANNNNAKDDNRHGTHCAGVIGAVGNNRIGVTGVNWAVSLIPIKFLGPDGGGTLDAAVQSIQYATKIGVHIMSNSWGGGGFSKAMAEAISAANARGIIFIAAAGNDEENNDLNPSYPASYQYDNVISVAATDNKDGIATFSNYGQTSVHVAAPGVNIISTVLNSAYAPLSGTSMAAPHVSGIAALMLAANPSQTHVQIKDTLIRTSDPVRALAKKVVAKGRVNAYNAIHGVIPSVATPTEAEWKTLDLSLESPHPYAASKTYSYPVSVPKAKFVRVIFEMVDTEEEFDTIAIQDASGQVIEKISGTRSNYISEYVEGSSATLVLKTDDSMNGRGFKVSKVQAIY